MTNLIAAIGTTVDAALIRATDAETAQAMDEAQALNAAVTAAAAKKAEVREAYDMVPASAPKSAPAPAFRR